MQTEPRIATFAGCPMDKHESRPRNGMVPASWANSAHESPSFGPEQWIYERPLWVYSVEKLVAEAGIVGAILSMRAF